MSWHFLQGSEAASWEGTSLDGAPDALLNLLNTRDKCCSLGSGMDFCHGSRFGTTCEPSTGAPGAAELTLFQVGSPAKTFRRQDKGLGLTANDLAFGGRWRELSVRYDRDTCSWRTHRSLWDEDLQSCSLTLPRWGLMLDGVLWEQVTLAPLTAANDSGLLPTLTANDCKPAGKVEVLEYRQPNRRTTVQRLRSAVTEPHQIGLPVNPTWAEWFMGHPEGWSDCAPLAMDKYLLWRQRHGRF
jgi:hypothetical protein